MNPIMKTVTFRDVSEKYRIKFVVNGKDSWEDFWALKSVNFSVDKAETLAIIGENGAGKSTILKLIAGMLKTDKGEVCVLGKVSALLELGAGFYPEFTGRENLYLNTSLFGLTREEIDAKFDEIVEFSGIGRFIDAQVKSYSQGMFVRLAFAIAIHINPDILLIDDTLSVGDEDFQRKCIYKILELKESGKTIIFVTHDMNTARRLCARGIFLRSGEIIKDGPINMVISYYMETLGDRKGIAIFQKDDLGVVFNNGKLIVRWKDKTITQGQGGYSSFFFNEHHFNSLTANWRADVENANLIVAKGQWFGIPVAQVWEIRMLDDNQLQLEVALEIKGKYSVENLQVEILFRKEYKKWFSSERKGVFPENFFHERECELIYDDPIDKLAGFKGDCKENGQNSLPAVIVDAFGQQIKALLFQILNSGLDITARIIRLKLPNVYESVENDVDKKFSLSMKLKLIGNDNQDALEEYVYKCRKLIGVEKERIENKKIESQAKQFTFGSGRFSLHIDENNLLHMFYDGKKITSGFGIKTTLLIGKEWKDTYTRQMFIKKIAENHIQVHNISWIDIPAIQTWSFLMKEEGVIEVMMRIEVQSQIKIHEIHVAIFFSQAYTKWLTIHESGNFGENLGVEGEILLKDKNTRAVGVASMSLPTVVLDLSRDLKYLLRIWNSDPTFSSPVVEALTEDMEFREGRIEFFKGIICITEDKNSINEEICGVLGSEHTTEESFFNKEDSGDQSLYLVDDKEIRQQAAMLSSGPQNRLSEILRMHALGKVGIAVSRYNFFKLDKILKFYANIFNRKIDLDNCVFNHFPVKTIFNNFIEYLKQIKSAAEALGVRLVLKDQDLFDILKTVSRQSTAYNGKQLLRFLGVTCEHAFIGPRQIVIDLYHRCNANCVHCWFHNPKTTLSEEYLNMRLGFDSYRKIIDDAQQLSVELIILEGNGEPLLEQSFPKMAKYTKDKGIMLSFSTNGILFNQDMAKMVLFDFDVDRITCSLPAATEKTYSLVNPKQANAGFQQVVQNMSYFIKLRNSAGIKKPCLAMNHVIHALNCHELIKMAELDARIGADIVQFRIMQKPDKNIKHLALASEQIEMIKQSLDRITAFLRQKNIILDESFLNQLKIIDGNALSPLKGVCDKRECFIGWFQTLVFANSEVSMCQLKVIDTLAGSSFKEVWNSEKYNMHRIQAKYLKDNKEVVFANGKKLFDEDCEQCDIVKDALRIE